MQRARVRRFAPLGILRPWLAMALAGWLWVQPAPGHSMGGLDYQPSRMCQGCHDKIFAQHLGCGHETSFTNPAFQAQYFRELLPQIARDPGLIEEARACTACHAPIFYQRTGRHVTPGDRLDPENSGVTCDLCHTISGYEGARPENGDFISKPGQQKLGPFRHAGDWHHIYSELQTKSEFCAICHNAVNRHGLEIKATYSEWKASRYAQDGIECQHCHMSVDGFLTAGKAAYEAGRAATMSLGQAPARSRLYTHRFPGAHSRSQVQGAITVAIAPDGFPVSGDEVGFRVTVDNRRTGHKMPSGSADLRLLWLDVEADIRGERRVVPAVPGERTGALDVAGMMQLDDDLLGDDVPRGSRIYRAVFVDRDGRPTLASYDATGVAFDNRLEAGEIRTERYRVAIPRRSPSVQLTARLYYLAYPGSFAAKLGLARAIPVEVAAATMTLSLR
jgi:hypothetical protein